MGPRLTSTALYLDSFLMENASSWHFRKKDDFERLNSPGKKPQTDEKSPSSFSCT